eukprot:TRINITY_DN28196_c0_g1_i1.p2 TRINITY_DN28196_c0_g1~~TRINITY_DN28196_c0_g1_i1.p2  ORF type:complete len:123 (+),score=49.11 TRINITY_DN28196_c0_g1_i1:139-507(+)
MNPMRYINRESVWNSNLSDLCMDTEVFIQGLFCPFYLQAKNKATIEGRNVNLLDVCCCSNEYFTRQSIRNRHNLGMNAQTNCTDLAAAACCWQCMLCQHNRELRMKRHLTMAAYVPTTLEME